MPHLVIEHSAELKATHDLQGLCERLFDMLVAHPSVGDPASVRVRTIACTEYRLGVDPQSFAHATLLLLPGREQAVRETMARMILDELEAAMPEVGSLTVRLDDLNPPYLKRML